MKFYIFPHPKFHNSHFIIKSIGHPKAIKLNINPNLITTGKKLYFLSTHLKCPNSTLKSRGRINL